MTMKATFYTNEDDKDDNDNNRAVKDQFTINKIIIK